MCDGYIVVWAAWGLEDSEPKKQEVIPVTQEAPGRGWKVRSARAAKGARPGPRAVASPPRTQLISGALRITVKVAFTVLRRPSPALPLAVCILFVG